jgi:hypothetical protein
MVSTRLEWMHHFLDAMIEEREFIEKRKKPRYNFKAKTHIMNYWACFSNYLIFSEGREGGSG